jgi:hypothetical protein
MRRECDVPVGNADNLERIGPTRDTEHFWQCYSGCGLDRANQNCPGCGLESTAAEDSSLHAPKQANGATSPTHPIVCRASSLTGFMSTCAAGLESGGIPGVCAEMPACEEAPAPETIHAVGLISRGTD